MRFLKITKKTAIFLLFSPPNGSSDGGTAVAGRPDHAQRRCGTHRGNVEETVATAADLKFVSPPLLYLNPVRPAGLLRPPRIVRRSTVRRPPLHPTGNGMCRNMGLWRADRGFVWCGRPPGAKHRDVVVVHPPHLTVWLARLPPITLYIIYSAAARIGIMSVRRFAARRHVRSFRSFFSPSPNKEGHALVKRIVPVWNQKTSPEQFCKHRKVLIRYFCS